MPLIHKIFLGALIFAMLAVGLYKNRPLPPGPAPITQPPSQTPAPIATASPTPQPTSTYTGIYIKTYPNPDTSFKYAKRGQTWKINESNKILLKSPNLPPDKWTMLEYMVTTIQTDEYITILKSQGIINTWFYVSLSIKPGGIPRARGWIQQNSITNATLW